jgi:hypothetical protein
MRNLRNLLFGFGCRGGGAFVPGDTGGGAFTLPGGGGVRVCGVEEVDDKVDGVLDIVELAAPAIEPGGAD